MAHFSLDEPIYIPRLIGGPSHGKGAPVPPWRPDHYEAVHPEITKVTQIDDYFRGELSVTPLARYERRRWGLPVSPGEFIILEGYFYAPIDSNNAGPTRVA